ncbi:hypothetical protein SAMN05421823_112160 [Catalinimonas alkaloidigena]|uniref:Lipoprotein n=1 Tax=Catalinimonas alkaloidigena TaxID=1075417 RepID=A0A1G9SGY1_9BACT|nr:hypothetical protein SAMN05421823_112160 [Catalinimonas alkaloidigena]
MFVRRYFLLLLLTGCLSACRTQSGPSKPPHLYHQDSRYVKHK